MQVRISSPKHYEAKHGASHLVRVYLDQIESKVGEALSSEAIDIIRISLLIAHPEELAEGKFLPYEQFDWRCKYAAVGVNGDFERYHLGDNFEKISVLAEMLQTAFIRISKKRKAKIDYSIANEIVLQTTRSFVAGRTGAGTVS